MRYPTLCGSVLLLGVLSACAEVPPAGPFDETGQPLVLMPPIAPLPPVSTTPLAPQTASSRVIRSTDMAPPPLETGVVGDIPPSPVSSAPPDETPEIDDGF